MYYGSVFIKLEDVAIAILEAARATPVLFRFKAFQTNVGRPSG